MLSVFGHSIYYFYFLDLRKHNCDFVVFWKAILERFKMKRLLMSYLHKEYPHNTTKLYVKAFDLMT